MNHAHTDHCIVDALDAPNTPLGPGDGGLGAPTGPGESSAASTALLERTEQEQAPGDHERFAHYVRKDKMLQSAVEGEPVVALCGKVWTPVRNPDRFPVCPICKEIYKNIQGGGSGGSWPLGPNPPQS